MSRTRAPCVSLAVVVMLSACGGAVRAKPVRQAKVPSLRSAPAAAPVAALPSSKPAPAAAPPQSLSPPADSAARERPDGVLLLHPEHSRGCTTKNCDCCNSCGAVRWKPPLDVRELRVVASADLLPRLVANECALHYELRAQGVLQGDRFVVRSVQPVPSQLGRSPNTQAVLGLRASESVCAELGGEEAPSCDHCGHERWLLEPTHDAVVWSGKPLPEPERSDCAARAQLVVHGHWRGIDAFEVSGFSRRR